MTPDGALRDFDLIVRPAHDRPLTKTSVNALTITGAAHRITPEKVAHAKDRWEELFKMLPAPYTTVFVGGGDQSKRIYARDGPRPCGKTQCLWAQNGGELASFHLSTHGARQC